MTEDKSLVKSEQHLRLFSSRRQPPLLVVFARVYDFLPRNSSHFEIYDFLPHEAVKLCN